MDTEDMGTVDMSSIVSASQLFADHSVRQLLQFSHKIDNDVANKRQELRNLVGSKYRDLLHVADDIIAMNDLVHEEDDSLRHLIHREAKYRDRTLQNHTRFHRSVTDYKKADLMAANAIKVVKKMLKELDALHAQILDLVASFDAWNTELNDDDDAVAGSTEEFTSVAIFVYMIEFFFADTLDAHPRQKQALASYRAKFLAAIEYMLSSLVVDAEVDLVLNLLTAYLILTLKTPLEILADFLGFRFAKFATFNLNSFEFQNSLKYLFNTFGYISLFRSKLVTTAVRTIHVNNSSTQNAKNWSRHQYIAKWQHWIADYASRSQNMAFPLSVADLKSINDATVEAQLDAWKLQVSDHIANEIVFERAPVALQVDKLSTILTAFKHYTSLVSLQASSADTDLVHDLTARWRTTFTETVMDKMAKFKQIADDILDIARSDHVVLDQAPLSLIFSKKEDDLSDVAEYLAKISDVSSNLVGPHKKILIDLEDFYSEVRSLQNTQSGLSGFKAKVMRPFLSIDDTEDDQFWEGIGSTIEEIYTGTMRGAKDYLAGVESEFIQELDQLAQIGIADVSKVSNILRCLASLNTKPRFSDYFDASHSDRTVQVSKQYSAVMRKFLEPLLTDLTASSRAELKKEFETRIKAATQEETGQSEAVLWEKTEDGKPIATQPSYDIVVKAFRFSSSLLHRGEYTDIMEIEECLDLKVTLVENLISEIVTLLKDQLDVETSKGDENTNPAEPAIEEQENSEVDSVKKKKKKNKKKAKSKMNSTQASAPPTGDSDNADAENVDEEKKIVVEETASEKDDAGPLESEESSENASVPFSTETSLLTYTDILYLSCFTAQKIGSIQEEKSIEDPELVKLRKVLKIDESFGTKELIRIHRNIWDFYKNKRSLYAF